MKEISSAVFDIAQINILEINNPHLKRFVEKIANGDRCSAHGDTYGEHEDRKGPDYWDCGFRP